MTVAISIETQQAALRLCYGRQGTHLWCGPCKGEGVHALGEVSVAEDVGKTNIADLGSSVACEQHISGFEVKVDDAVAMQEVQPASDLQRYPAPPAGMQQRLFAVLGAGGIRTKTALEAFKWCLEPPRGFMAESSLSNHP